MPPLRNGRNRPGANGTHILRPACANWHVYLFAPAEVLGARRAVRSRLRDESPVAVGRDEGHGRVQPARAPRRIWASRARARSRACVRVRSASAPLSCVGGLLSVTGLAPARLLFDISANSLSFFRTTTPQISRNFRAKVATRNTLPTSLFTTLRTVTPHSNPRSFRLLIGALGPLAQHSVSRSSGRCSAASVLPAGSLLGCSFADRRTCS